MSDAGGAGYREAETIRKFYFIMIMSRYSMHIVLLST